MAILARESDGADLMQRIAGADRVITSPVAVFEAVLALARIGNAPFDPVAEIVDGFLSNVSAELVPIDADTGRGAFAAYDRFGKGRHRASLNMGDCFAYACARHHREPLLFKSNDFAATDIEAA